MENIEKGEFVSIVGASGAGKTTLLHLLGTLDKIQGGSLVINGSETKNLSEKDASNFRNQEIGFVFQFHNLLNEFTALENVCLPAYLNGISKKDAERKISQMKEQVKNDIKNASVKIAIESVSNLLKNSIDKSKLDKIYSSSIEETKLALKKKSS